MKLTTPEPPIDLLEVLPELADLRATTVRLHPRKGRVPGRHASKMGGTFLWPSDEPWPVCDERWPPSWTPAVEDGIPIPEGDPRAVPFPLVPVLQLRAEDFPEMLFPPGADLFQLLWCPLGHDYAFMPKPFVFWRNTGEVRRPRRTMPEPDLAAIEMEPGFLPEPRTLHPERVVEFPPMAMWPKDSAEDDVSATRSGLPEGGLPDRARRDPLHLQGLPERVPGQQGGGLRLLGPVRGDAHVRVRTPHGAPADLLGQRDATPRAARGRGAPLDAEAGPGPGGPERDDRRGVLSGMLYVFICRACPGWPIRAVSQR